MEGLSSQQLKVVSLITLTGQNALLGLSMRYSRTRSFDFTIPRTFFPFFYFILYLIHFRNGDMFYEATAVFMAEVFKFFTCLLLVYNEEGKSVDKFRSSLYQSIWVNKLDTFKVNVRVACHLSMKNSIY